MFTSLIGVFKPYIQAVVMFLDTFSDGAPTTLDGRPSDSGHFWEIFALNSPGDSLTELNVDGSGNLRSVDTDIWFKPIWTPATTTWYFEMDVTIDTDPPASNPYMEFMMKELDDGNFYGPSVTLTPLGAGSPGPVNIDFSSNDQNFLHFNTNTTAASTGTQFTLRLEVINNEEVRLLVDGNPIYQTFVGPPSGTITYPNPLVRPIMRIRNTLAAANQFAISRVEANDFLPV